MLLLELLTLALVQFHSKWLPLSLFDPARSREKRDERPTQRRQESDKIRDCAELEIFCFALAHLVPILSSIFPDNLSRPRAEFYQRRSPLALIIPLQQVNGRKTIDLVD